LNQSTNFTLIEESRTCVWRAALVCRFGLSTALRMELLCPALAQIEQAGLKSSLRRTMRRISFLWAVVFCMLLVGASAHGQSVVVNKYFNSGTTADVVELLVVQDNLDMRGMIIKDFSSSMAN